MTEELILRSLWSGRSDWTFESKATRAHNDHIAKTQADWKKTQDNLFAFKDKVMLYQEKEMTTRHELVDAANFFELSGYIIIQLMTSMSLKRRLKIWSREFQ